MSVMVVNPIWLVGGLILSLLMVLSCSEASQETGAKQQTGIVAASDDRESLSVPQELKVGEEKFNANCSRCHGIQARGTNNGPPLVHKIYEPNHHGDVAFQRAAAQGVRAHHWKFGNMPKVDGVSSDDVTKIIQYVRWLQRQAGIY